MLKKIKKEKKPVIAGQKTKAPWLFGIMELKKDRIVKIIEKPKKGEEPSNIKNVGVYYLEPSFFSYYKKVKKGPADLIDALSEYMKEKEVKLALIKKEESKTPAFLKYPWHLFGSRDYLFEKYLEKKIENTAKISKEVTIKGKVYIGKNTKILEGTTIKGPCYIGENCFIGNNCIIEGYTNIESNAMVGAFSRIKGSIFQKSSCIYSSYVADSIIGEETQIGENVKILNINEKGKEILSEVKGEIVNTGLKSFGTIIGKASIIGTEVEILPGKFIGSNCRIHPNNIIKENIKDCAVLK
jgi:bifunctional UDP-N-acetylglucosamine pyrophosphorylase/glucosamine-1-phosphate N-acetyltransferase